MNSVRRVEAIDPRKERKADAGNPKINLKRKWDPFKHLGGEFFF